MFLHAIPCMGRHAAPGVSWKGLASRCHDVTGHVSWSGIRTRDSRIERPMLYPTELSSGDVPESNRCGRRLRRCLTPRPSSCRTPVSTPRHTPRQRRAHRTGHKPVPLRRVRRCSALPAVANRQSVRARGAQFVVPFKRRSRRSITTQRTCAGCSRAPASGRAGALPGCSRAETRGFLVGWNETCSMHAHPPRTPETKSPRDLRPEGIRVPREIGVADLPGSQP